MYIVRRKLGEAIHVTDSLGNVLIIRAHDIVSSRVIRLQFTDPERRFEIRREETLVSTVVP